MPEIVRLTASEYPLLASVADGYVPEPATSVVVAARDGKQIIGRIFLVAPWHVEGVFVDERWRGGPIFRRLVEAIELEAQNKGISRVFAYAATDQMKDYIARCGYSRLPWKVMHKDVS